MSKPSVFVNKASVVRLCRNKELMALPEMALIQNALLGIKRSKGCSSCRKRKKLMSMYPVFVDGIYAALSSGKAPTIYRVFKSHFSLKDDVNFKLDKYGVYYSFNNEGLV